MKDDATRLRHIRECIERITEWTTQGREDFVRNPILQEAVARQLEVIGEASKALSDEIRSKHHEIPWKGMAGLRDILIHDYDVIDVEEVWRVVVEDLPQLRKKLASISIS